MDFNIKRRLLASLFALPSGFFLFLVVWRMVSGGAYEEMTDGSSWWFFVMWTLLVLALLSPSILNLFIFELTTKRKNSFDNFYSGDLTRKITYLSSALIYALILSCVGWTLCFLTVLFIDFQTVFIMDGINFLYFFLMLFSSRVEEYIRYIYFGGKSV